MPSPLRPIPGAPALLLGGRGNARPRTLLVADLHLGLAGTPERPRGPPGGAAPEMADRLIALGRSARAKRVVVAGDVKHPIVGTPPPLRPIVFGFFSDLLGDGLAVEVVLGNHDGGLVAHLPREVVVHPSDGVVVDGVGVFHGHRWPARALGAAPRWVVGHLHPGYRFAPTAEHPDGKRPCWIRAVYPTGSRRPRPDRPAPRLPRELVVLPPFNPIAGIESLNRERPARGRSFLYRRLLAPGSARAYLLDGTDLGPVATGGPAEGPDGAPR